MEEIKGGLIYGRKGNGSRREVGRGGHVSNVPREFEM